MGQTSSAQSRTQKRGIRPYIIFLRSRDWESRTLHWLVTVDEQARHSILLSVIISIYVTPHSFVLLTCGPSAAMLVPPAPQH